MTHVETTNQYPGAVLLAMLAGWKSAPKHRALEAEASELADLTERDHAARTAFARRAGQ